MEPETQIAIVRKPEVACHETKKNGAKEKMKDYLYLNNA